MLYHLLVNALLVHDSRFKSNDGKSDHSCKSRHHEIGCADQEGVFVYIIIDRVVTSKGDETTKTHAEREEGLGGGIQPSLDV